MTKKKHKERLNIRKLGCCDVFSFYSPVANIIKLGCREFAETSFSYPNGFTMKSWQEYCKSIADDIEEWQKCTSGSAFDIKKEYRLEKNAHKAIIRFAKEWRNFWI